jgi:hypothetical protein
VGGSIYNFGLQLGATHGFVGKEEWYRRAAEAGDPAAMRFLGDILGDQGDTAAQEQWYRRAAVAGDPAGMCALGALLAGMGRQDEANEWNARGTAAMKALEKQ